MSLIQRWAVVRENELAAIFCVVPEVLDNKIGRKELSFQCAATLLGRLQGLWGKGWWSSMVTFSLIEDGADRCLGNSDNKRQLGSGTSEVQRCRLRKTVNECSRLIA